MREYVFEAMWVRTTHEYCTIFKIKVEASTEQVAFEKAFDKAMEIHKKAAKKKF